MRPVLHGDAVAAARVLYGLFPEERAEALERLIRAATWAERFRRRYHRAHPYWGDGSLMAAAFAEVVPTEPPLADADYCRCLAQVLARLAQRPGPPETKRAPGTPASSTGAAADTE